MEEIPYTNGVFYNILNFFDGEDKVVILERM